MKLANYFFIALGITIITMFIFNNFYTQSFFGMLIGLLLFGGTLYYIDLIHQKNEALKKLQNSMRYWFDIVNEELSKMSGVNLMVWDSAVDKIIKHRKYKVGNQYKDFVAFYGLFDTVLGVVILCKDDKSIVDFNTRPISQMYNDPFFEFNPEKSSQGIPDMYNRRDNKGTNFYFGNDKKKFDIDEDTAREVGGFGNEK